MAQLEADYPEDVRVVYRHFPLIDIHDKATLATQASEAAGKQGMFWEMHDVLFQRQSEWANLSISDFLVWTEQRASELGLDLGKFKLDRDSDELANFAQSTYDQAAQIGLPGTPFLLINNNVYNGPMDYNNLATIVKLLALQKHQYNNCPPMVIDPEKEYQAILETEKGTVVIELLPQKAPLAVNNFVFLAREGWYNGITFHRVLTNPPMAQSGDPSGTGYGGPGYAFINETSDLKFDKAGLLAMANAGPDSNGGQFFITSGPAPHLDGSYSIFGRVIEGQSIVDNLTYRDPSQNANQPPGDSLISVTIVEK